MSGIGNNFKKTNKNINKDFPYNQWFDQECKALKSLLKDKHIGNERQYHLQRVYRGTLQRKKTTILSTDSTALAGYAL